MRLRKEVRFVLSRKGNEWGFVVLGLRVRNPEGNLAMPALITVMKRLNAVNHLAKKVTILADAAQLKCVSARDLGQFTPGFLFDPGLGSSQVIVAVEPAELVTKFFIQQCYFVETGANAIVNCHDRIVIGLPVPNKPLQERCIHRMHVISS